jgi:D-sedoheptulose 7-phosphate isomerase
MEKKEFGIPKYQHKENLERSLCDMKKDIEKLFLESIEIIQDSMNLSDIIERTTKEISHCIENGHRIYIFGNGGSAADAQHIAAELIGRFKLERESVPAVALSTDTSILTSIANDYSYEKIFSRQCESLVNEGDVIIGISTSGNSKNVIEGIMMAKKKKAITIGLLGNNGGKIGEIVDIPIIVNSEITSKIQEVHRIVYHIICELLENELVKKEKS